MLSNLSMTSLNCEDIKCAAPVESEYGETYVVVLYFFYLNLVHSYEQFLLTPSRHTARDNYGHLRGSLTPKFLQFPKGEDRGREFNSNL